MMKTLLSLRILPVLRLVSLVKTRLKRRRLDENGLEMMKNRTA